MRLGLLVPDVDDPTDFTVRAEALGYDSAWMAELWGESAVARLADVAARTETIGLGTAIVNVFSRTPAVLAMTAKTIDDISGGRFTLGVGTSTRKAVEDLHGMDWNDPNPVRRAHECIELTKAYLTGDGRVNYDGDVFHAADFPTLDHEVPVYHAALGRANRRVVARLCDGWIPHNVPFPDLPESFEYIAERAEEAGRDPEHIDVAPYVPACVSDDGEEARRAVRKHIAYYVGSGEGYQRAVAERFPDGAERVANRWHDGERKVAVESVTEEMVGALGVAGTPDEAREQLREIAGMDVIDRPLLVVPNGAEQLAEQTVEELSPHRL